MILIIDFGSQYTQLIARRVREIGAYCEIVPFHKANLNQINKEKTLGIVLSGGPQSVYNKNAPLIDKSFFDINKPILGICYGMQLISYLLGGEIQQGEIKEYGKAHIQISANTKILKDINQNNVVWMSHGDKIIKAPSHFHITASTKSCEFGAIEHKDKDIYALQFHPEVVHTQGGKKILQNFVIDICGCPKTWNMSNFLSNQIEEIKNKVQNGQVLCALSGGVDSSVVASILHKAIGDKLIPIFVDNGLLRANEKQEVSYMLKNKLGINLIVIDAKDIFLEKLKHITDPEQKRKIIGKTFIEIFENEAKKYDDIKYLAQGTLYPDIIESVSVNGHSQTIKSHHNVGGLPSKMRLKLIEPLRELFKDEVRELGKVLQMPLQTLKRHPFPGPGLAIRIMGSIDNDKLDLLRKADSVLIQELMESGYYDKTWQAFCVLLNVQSVGVMGDNRTYENSVCIRVVEASDGMSATFAHLPHDLLEKISTRIINEVSGINRVVYDISSKPPATIEWE